MHLFCILELGGKQMTFDVRCEAVCPTCGTRWRARRDNTFEIVVR